MKTFRSPLARGLSAAAVLATYTLATQPLTSHAERGDPRRGPPDQGRGAAPAAPARQAPAPQARPAPVPQARQAPAPQARAPSVPRAAPQRPAFVPQAAVPRAPVSVPGFNNGRQQSGPSAAAIAAASAAAAAQRNRERDRDTYVRPQSTTPYVTDRDRSRDPRLPGTIVRPRPSTDPVITGDRSRYPSDSRYPGGSYRPTYDPRGVFNNGRQQAVAPPVSYPRPNRSFVDASRFSHINRNVAFQSYPRQHYRLCYGNGFHGLGWYFGPPNFSYYYEYPGVQYYASREYIPSTYLSLRYSATNSLDYSIQRALYDRGYYDGPLDGDIGPASRMAIANFQADNGLEPTGIIDETLLRYLQLE